MAGAEDGVEFDWTVRHFVYAHFAEHGRPPAADEAAASLGIGVDEARAAYARLHARHAILLEPGGGAIRMANPFSAVPTAYRVRANGRGYWANCAWDALGIPAALRSDAEIEAACPDGEAPVRLIVANGEVHGSGEIVHFSLPFRRWYDDLIRT